MIDVRRRTAMRMLGAGLAVLAGCSEMSDGNGTDDTDGSDNDTDGNDGDGSEPSAAVDGDLPSYASILPTTDRAAYFYGAIDVETMRTLLEEEGAESGSEPTDPLVGNPIAVALLCSFGLQMLGSSPGFDAYDSNNETADGGEHFVYAEGVYALVGAYDYDGLTADLEAAGYAVETEGDAYAVYVDDESGEVVGITEDTYAYSYPNGGDSAFDPVAAVERTAATAAGERDPYHEGDADFERLLRAGENDGITCCLYTSEDEFASGTLSNDRTSDGEGFQFAFDAFEGAYGVHQQLGVGDDEGATVSAVVAYDGTDRVDEDRLESSLGTDANPETVQFRRERSWVEIAAEYGGDFARE